MGIAISETSNKKWGKLFPYYILINNLSVCIYIFLSFSLLSLETIWKYKLDKHFDTPRRDMHILIRSCLIKNLRFFLIRLLAERNPKNLARYQVRSERNYNNGFILIWDCRRWKLAIKSFTYSKFRIKITLLRWKNHIILVRRRYILRIAWLKQTKLAKLALYYGTQWWYFIWSCEVVAVRFIR